MPTIMRFQLSGVSPNFERLSPASYEALVTVAQALYPAHSLALGEWTADHRASFVPLIAQQLLQDPNPEVEQEMGLLALVEETHIWLHSDVGRVWADASGYGLPTLLAPDALELSFGEE